MKKLILSLCMLLALTACKDENKNTAVKPVITIGATLPLTGDAAEAGEAARAGLEMTLEDLQKGNLKYDYKIIYEDNQMNPQKVATSINKLINIDHAKAILSFWNLMGNVSSALADQNGVFSLTCSIGEDSTRGKYNFNNYASNFRQAKVLVEKLKRENTKTVALFTDNSGMRQQYEVVKDYIRENSDIEIVFEEFFNPGEKDYKASIIKASSKTPDMYLFSGYNPSTYIFMKQLKEITGRNDNVTTIDMFFDMALEHRDIIEGLWYVDSNLNGTEEFENRLLKEKGLVSQSCTGNTAANLEIIVKAYENAKVEEGETIPNNDNVREWIFSNVKDFDTVGGKVTVVRDGLFDKEPSIKKMINRKPIVVE
ncbi:MAG: ABC transporter substrate-binding protein [Alphaproteobacteria bacterium]|nr:ABC transporter substrate-binding protein [Alphaproteobacteria bacterium]